MDLLFDKNNAGSAELKALIGHIDANIKFANIKSDIITATNELIKIIGQPMYDDALSKYDTDSQVEADLDLIYNIRYAIALDGYRHFAKSSDVAHGNNGRKIFVDEQTKVPFQWMLDRDDEILERKYYKAVDDLIDYLDANSAIWKASNAYKETQKYFVRTTADFEEFFPIDSRLLLIKLQSGLRQCEQKLIKPIITQIKFDGLKTKLKEGTPLTDDEASLLELIKEACVFHALSWGMRVLRVALFPEGVLQRYTSDRQNTTASKPSEKLETELAAQEFSKRSVEVLQVIQQNISVTDPTEADEEVLKAISEPDFNFDDCDKFASL